MPWAAYRLARPGPVRYNLDVPTENALQFAIEFGRILDDCKCSDVLALDLSNICSITDYTVIATGTSDRQIRAAADAILAYAKKLGQRPYGSEGFENAGWVVIDFVDVVVHIFARSYREYYDLELLWGDAPRVNWARVESA